MPYRLKARHAPERFLDESGLGGSGPGLVYFDGDEAASLNPAVD
jgi:hypothetical protein